MMREKISGTVTFGQLSARQFQNSVKSHNYFINYRRQFFVIILFLLARCSVVAWVCWLAIEVG
jgi:hypothetical protein